jgi:hypothetical protein
MTFDSMLAEVFCVVYMQVLFLGVVDILADSEEVIATWGVDISMLGCCIVKVCL